LFTYSAFGIRPMKECDALIFKWHASKTRGMLWEIVDLLVFCKSDPNVDLIFGCYLGHPALPRLSRSRPYIDASVQECLCKTRKKICLCKLLLLLELVFCEWYKSDHTLSYSYVSVLPSASIHPAPPTNLNTSTIY
jgi:hypothetical protein